MAKIRIEMTIPDEAASDLLRMLTMFQRNHPGCEIAVSGGNGDEVARALSDMGARFVVLTEKPDGTVH
jgi:hypothetical protein